MDILAGPRVLFFWSSFRYGSNFVRRTWDAPAPEILLGLAQVYDPNGRASQLIHLKMIDFCIETQSQFIHLKMPMIYLCIEIQLVTVAP